MITRTQPLIVASNIVAGRTYRKQTGDQTPFTVLVISDGYMVDPGDSIIKNHRKAIAVDANGFFYMQPIYGTQRFYEIEEDVPVSDAIVTTISTETKTFEQQMQDALAKVERERQATAAKRDQEKAKQRSECLAEAKRFTDWLGIPGELEYDAKDNTAYVVFQNVTFLLYTTVRDEDAFIRVYMKRGLPHEEGFRSDWQAMRHEIAHGWVKVNDAARTRILAEIAETIPQINAAYAAELERYETWKNRPQTPAPITQNHTVLFWHDGSGRDDELLCKKMDAGYRIVSMSAYGNEDASGAYILLSRMEHPIVRQRVVDVGEI